MRFDESSSGIEFAFTSPRTGGHGAGGGDGPDVRPAREADAHEPGDVDGRAHAQPDRGAADVPPVASEVLPTPEVFCWSSIWNCSPGYTLMLSRRFRHTLTVDPPLEGSRRTPRKYSQTR